jgi:hypothetical protein
MAQAPSLHPTVPLHKLSSSKSAQSLFSTHWGQKSSPAAQEPSTQVSPTVHETPSEQTVPLAAFSILQAPVSGSHIFCMQSELSVLLHATGLPGAMEQEPSIQARVPLHRFPSSCSEQSASLSQGQFSSSPGMQAPSLHWSARVQVFPSSQSASFGVKIQPRSGAQESSVQGLPSSHRVMTAFSALHSPWMQSSPAVQASPSSQAV